MSPTRRSQHICDSTNVVHLDIAKRSVISGYTSPCAISGKINKSYKLLVVKIIGMKETRSLVCFIIKIKD